MMQNKSVEKKKMEKIQPVSSLIFCIVVEWGRTPIGVYCMKGRAFLSTVSKVFAGAMCLDNKHVGYSGLGISSKN